MQIFANYIKQRTPKNLDNKWKYSHHLIKKTNKRQNKIFTFICLDKTLNTSKHKETPSIMAKYDKNFMKSR